MYDYDYEVKEAVKRKLSAFGEDLRTLAESEEFREHLLSDLWADDDVTGNESGSFFCSAYGADEAICGNLPLLYDALAYFGDGIEALKSPEKCDVTIRCYVLPWAIDDAINELLDQ